MTDRQATQPRPTTEDKKAPNLRNENKEEIENRAIREAAWRVWVYVYKAAVPDTNTRDSHAHKHFTHGDIEGLSEGREEGDVGGKGEKKRWKEVEKERGMK